MVIISHIVSSLITKFSILNILMNILHVFEHVSRLEFQDEVNQNERNQKKK